MVGQLMAWLRVNLPLLAAIGGLAVFLFYDRRKKILEIQKLELEIQKLRRETLIYRPSADEIKAVLQLARHMAIPTVGIAGGRDTLESFGRQLEEFVTRLLLYYGDVEARTQLLQRKLYATMSHVPEPLGGEIEQPFLPDPGPVRMMWHEVRAGVRSRLPTETVGAIDTFLSRFGSATTAA